MRDKLAREPIEDFRIDFEDGYGNRPDAEEDNHAGVVARELAKGMRDATLSPFIGMRIKPLNEELRGRSIRTLDLVLTALVEAGGIPDRWIVTVPKITIIEQVEYTVAVLRQLERKLGLADGTLALRGDGRDAADRARRERPVAPAADSRRVGRETQGRALRDVRLYGRASTSRRRTSACSIPPASSRSTSCRSRSRAPTCGSPTDRRR